MLSALTVDAETAAAIRITLVPAGQRSAGAAEVRWRQVAAGQMVLLQNQDAVRYAGAQRHCRER